MNRSSQWFVGQAISAIRHGIGSRLAFDMTRRAARWTSARRAVSEFPMQGLAVTVNSAPCLAIEDAVGCSAQVLSGQMWLTAEGSPRDTVADVGTTVPLELGVRFVVSAFSDSTTILITAPRHLPDVGFSLQERDGMRVITVTSGRSRLPSALSGSPAAIAAFARRCFAATRTATI
jgi:hypothetical protein